MICNKKIKVYLEFSTAQLIITELMFLFLFTVALVTQSNVLPLDWCGVTYAGMNVGWFTRVHQGSQTPEPKPGPELRL